jgi:UDP:flavonoid glycosyltransferase YjiC (YdhE family)
MRILMFNNPLAGHYLPLLPLARALRTQGHTVAFVTAASMAGAVESEGFALLPAGPTVEAAIYETARRTGVDILVQNTPELVAEFFAGTRVDLSVDEALTVARAWVPHLVVSEHCDFVGPLVARVLNAPSVIVAIGPMPEPEVLQTITATLRSRYRDRGLHPPTFAPFGDWLFDTCPPSLQRDGVLPPLERLALRPEPHQSLAGAPHPPRAPGTGRPRVLISLGTGPGAAPMLGPIFQSLSALDVDLAGTSDGGTAEGLGRKPGRVERVTFMPAAQLLDGVSAVVHHGGSGITFGAAALGIPAVVVPGTREQERQANRLQAAGAGLALPRREQEPDAVAAAVGRLLAEPAFITAAHRLRDEITAMPSASDLARRLTSSMAG